MGRIEHSFGERMLEAAVVLKPLGQLGVVDNQAQHDLAWDSVAFHLSVDRVVVRLGVLVGLILGDKSRDVLRGGTVRPSPFCSSRCCRSGRGTSA